MESTTEAKQFGIKAKGQRERIRCLKGESLTRAEAILAHCYDCTGGYADGARDCEIRTCSIYMYMPYRQSGVKLKRARSEKQILNDKKLSLLHPTGHSFINDEEINHPDMDINLNSNL